MGVVYSNDFFSNPNGFSGGTILTSPSGENFLGPFTMGGSTTLTLTQLAPHTTVSLSFTLDVIGSLDGDGETNPNSGPDPFLVSLNGTTIFNQTFANYPEGNTQNYPVPGSAPDTGAATVSTLGYSGFPGRVHDLTYKITLSNLPNASSTITLIFTGGANEDAGNEFYGIDDVLVSTNTSALPMMLNAVSNHDLTTLSGTAEANSSVSVFDGTKLVGTVTAANDGTWSLQANLKGNGIHSFTETATLAGTTLSSDGITLYTPSANQSLQGGIGNDVLIGRPNDTLTGNAGADTYVFNPGFGKETIKDFSAQQHDVIAFDHTLFANATAEQVLSQTHDSAKGAVIVVDAADTVTLTGVTVADLHASDFHFF